MIRRPPLLGCLVLSAPDPLGLDELAAAVENTEWVTVADTVLRFPGLLAADGSATSATRLVSTLPGCAHDPALVFIGAELAALAVCPPQDPRVVETLSRLYIGRISQVAGQSLNGRVDPSVLCEVAIHLPAILPPLSLEPCAVAEALHLVAAASPAARRAAQRSLLASSYDPVASAEMSSASPTLRAAVSWVASRGLIPAPHAPWAFSNGSPTADVVAYLADRLDGRLSRWETFSALAPWFTGSAAALADCVEAAAHPDRRSVTDDLDAVPLLVRRRGVTEAPESTMWVSMLDAGPGHADVLAAAWRWAAPRGDVAVLGHLAASPSLPGAVHAALTGTNVGWLRSRLALRSDVDASLWDDDGRRIVVAAIDTRRRADAWLVDRDEVLSSLARGEAVTVDVLGALCLSLPPAPNPLGGLLADALAEVHASVLTSGLYPREFEAASARWLIGNGFADRATRAAWGRRRSAVAVAEVHPRLSSSLAVRHRGLGAQLLRSASMRVRFHLVGSDALDDAAFGAMPWAQLADLLDAPGAMARLLQRAAEVFSGNPGAWRVLHRLVDDPALTGDLSVDEAIERSAAG